MSSTLWGERLSGVIFILIALYMGHLAWDFPAGGSMFPLFVSAVMIVVSAVMVVRTFLVPQDYKGRWGKGFSPAALKPLGLTALVVLYVLAIFRLGYYATTLIVLLTLPFALGLRRPVFIVCSALGATAFIYALFEVGLHAGMPSGILF